ncbi:hypothetical protein NDU88_007815 [Pleurodeles waltl]|uniref:Uncharacterized protein n=1 Tax=Pleurodeles waltl TaxID=8319 RepID=A0AAV7PR31_PLEWA|nr:hypothetical protein NDU88_007815 [Pleurodeles waltl]
MARVRRHKASTVAAFELPLVRRIPGNCTWPVCGSVPEESGSAQRSVPHRRKDAGAAFSADARSRATGLPDTGYSMMRCFCRHCSKRKIALASPVHTKQGRHHL